MPHLVGGAYARAAQTERLGAIGAQGYKKAPTNNPEQIGTQPYSWAGGRRMIDARRFLVPKWLQGCRRHTAARYGTSGGRVIRRFLLQSGAIGTQGNNSATTNNPNVIQP
eukprot:285796-Amphidinium_carterae.1